jgi:hypothetical protein
MSPETEEKVIELLKSLQVFLYRVGKNETAREINNLFKEMENNSEDK